MTREQAECRGILIGESPNAIQVMPDKKPASGVWWWIPRSQIGYMRKDKREDGGVSVVFTCPEWLIEEKEAWELVP